MGDEQKQSPLQSRKKIFKIWREFFTDTTLHGCKPIQHSHKHIIQRFLWSVLVLTAGLFLISYVLQLFVECSKSPFETQTRMERVTSMNLPAISICSTNQYSKAKFNLSKSTVDAMMARNLFIKRFGNFSDFIPDEEMDRVNNMRWDDIVIDKKSFIMGAYVNDRFVDIETQFVSTEDASTFMRCFTFNGIKDDETGGEITLANGQAMSVFLNISQKDFFPYTEMAGVNVILHDRKELPSPIAQTVALSPGFLTAVTLEPTKYQFLPKPFKSYGDEYCVDFEKTPPTTTLRWHSRYTWVACIQECVIRTAVLTCQCRPRLFTSDFQHERICSMEELYHCFYYTVGKVQTNVITHNTTECDCPKPCELVRYAIRSSAVAFPTRSAAQFLVDKGVAESYRSVREDFMAFQVTFDGMILHHVRHVPTFTFGEIISRLGGQMGFFLGASLLTLTELMETIIITIISLLSAKRGRKVRSVGTR